MDPGWVMSFSVMLESSWKVEPTVSRSD